MNANVCVGPQAETQTGKTYNETSELNLRWQYAQIIARHEDMEARRREEEEEEEEEENGEKEDGEEEVEARARRDVGREDTKVQIREDIVTRELKRGGRSSRWGIGGKEEDRERDRSAITAVEEEDLVILRRRQRRRNIEAESRAIFDFNAVLDMY